MNTFTLKMTALILMVLDHIGCYFDGAPVWLNWLGRLSYPLFLFCMVQGSNIFSISFTRPIRSFCSGLQISCSDLSGRLSICPKIPVCQKLFDG